jgi:hypothetical protein
LNQSENQRADALIKPNVLNKYASYTYLFTLSGLTNEEIENLNLIVNGKPHDVVARSAGIGQDGNFSDFKSQEFKFSKGTDETVKAEKIQRITDIIPDARNADAILKRGHDIFFERVNIMAVPRPNEDRKLMNFTKIEMEFSEPLGVTLFEKLRACAFNNGYIDHNDAPFLLTLEFRGYDSKGMLLGNVITKRHLPIVISNAEMDVSQAGTKYTLTAVPWTEFGMVNRFLYCRSQGSIPSALNSNQRKKCITLAGAMDEFARALNTAQDSEIKAQLRDLKDEYAITVHPNFATASADTAGFYVEGLDTAQGSDPIKITWKENDAVSKIITDVMLGLDLFKDIDKTVEKYWTDLDVAINRGDDPSAKAPDPLIPWFKILTTIYTEKEFDQKTKMHKKTIRFHIEPYSVHVLNLSIPGLGGSELWGKSVKKAYNYIFTGENTEIMDLKLNDKYAYFQARLLDTTRSQQGIQQSDKETPDQKKQRLVRRYYGAGTYPDRLSLRGYPDGSKSFDGGTQDRDSRSNADEFFDYLTSPRGDMMKVDMTIMGDPAFIGQDMFLPMGRNFSKDNNKADNGRLQQSRPGDRETVNSVGAISGFEWDDQRGCFNFDRSEPLVTLFFRFPTDIDENQGLMNFQNLEDVEFNGLYKVTQVESIFDQGTFTQQLLLVRFNNQTGGTRPILYEEDKAFGEATRTNIVDEIVKTNTARGSEGFGTGATD